MKNIVPVPIHVIQVDSKCRSFPVWAVPGWSPHSTQVQVRLGEMKRVCPQGHAAVKRVCPRVTPRRPLRFCHPVSAKRAGLLETVMNQQGSQEIQCITCLMCRSMRPTQTAILFQFPPQLQPGRFDKPTDKNQAAPTHVQRPWCNYSSNTRITLPRDKDPCPTHLDSLCSRNLAHAGARVSSALARACARVCPRACLHAPRREHRHAQGSAAAGDGAARQAAQHPSAVAGGLWGIDSDDGSRLG